jgi:hypothetical protein
VTVISYMRVLAVPAIHQGPFIRDSYFIHEGIGSAANTPEVPQTYLSLLIAVFIETIINLEHMNLSIISLNQDIYMYL